VQTIEGSRRISVDYERTAEILPGWKHLFKFSKMIEQPLI
jgi:hypothetical protein